MGRPKGTLVGTPRHHPADLCDVQVHLPCDLHRGVLPPSHLSFPSSSHFIMAVRGVLAVALLLAAPSLASADPAGGCVCFWLETVHACDIRRAIVCTLCGVRYTHARPTPPVPRSLYVFWVRGWRCGGVGRIIASPQAWCVRVAVRIVCDFSEGLALPTHGTPFSSYA